MAGARFIAEEREVSLSELGDWITAPELVGKARVVVTRRAGPYERGRVVVLTD
jgi:hypothetical protein